MPQPSLTIIRGGRLLDAAAHRLTPTDILVRGDEIAAMGPPGLAAPPDARPIDAAGKAIMPGLVNAHTHSQGNLGKALGDRWTLELLLNAGPWFNAERTFEDMYLSARIGAAEMILRGCTACYDLFQEMPAPSLDGLSAVGRAYAETGLRAVVAPMMADITFFDATPGLKDALRPPLAKQVDAIRARPTEELIRRARTILDGWPFDREQVQIALAPSIPLLCSDGFLTGARDLAAEYEVGFHTHMAESRVWAVAGMRKYGRTLTAQFDALGILGPRFTAAHAVWIEDDDMRRMADAGASIAHNPSSNMRLGSGLADVRRMVGYGVNVGIGTDSANCGDHLNMFEGMRLASYSSRVQDYDLEEWLTVEEVFAMATEGSARALGFGGRIGRIETGYKADIVLLDLDDIAFVPLNDITNQLVHCADGRAVDTVMIGGGWCSTAGALPASTIRRWSAKQRPRGRVSTRPRRRCEPAPMPSKGRSAPIAAASCAATRAQRGWCEIPNSRRRPPGRGRAGHGTPRSTARHPHRAGFRPNRR